MGKEETSFTESLSEDQSTASATSNINGRVVAACDSVVMAVWDFNEALRTGKIDILDVLLLAWLVLATCVFLGFTIYENTKRKEEKLDKKDKKGQGISDGVYGGAFNSAGSSLTHSGLLTGGRDSTDGDQYGWLNSVVAWLFTQHSQQSPGQLASSWLKALNEESRKHGSSVQVTFDRIKPGSAPPKFQHVQAVAGPKDHLIVTCQLESAGFGFIVFATQQTAASVKLSTCDVSVNRLSGKVRCQVRGLGEEWHLAANWERRPDLQLNIKPQKNSNTRQNDGVDLVVVEEILRNAIMAATFNLSLPMRSLPREIITATNAIHTNTARQPTYPSMSNNTNRMPQHVHHAPIVPSSTNHVSSKPPTMAETRLLVKAPSNMCLVVKVIKANGLLVRSGGSSSDPYCIAMLDHPPQRYKTNTIVNTTNPFWDEHFLFQLNGNSRELRFEVWDKGSNDLFFGDAQVPVDTLEHMRGSRHILPLNGVTGDGESVKGSLTVWFLFMESAEQNTEIKPRQPVSPTKRVETSRSIAPDGTVITMVTTTTAKPKAGERRTGSNEAPMRVVTTAASLPTPQRPGMYPNGEGGVDRSHHSTGTQSSLEAPRQRTSSATQTPGPSIIIRETRHDLNTPSAETGSRSVSDAAIRHLSESAGDNRQKTPTKKSTLTIHGVSQEKSQPTFLVSETPNVDLSTLSDEPADSSFKRDASPNRSKRGFKLFRRRSKKEKASRSVSLDESDLDRARQQAVRNSEGTSTLPLPDHRSNTLEVPTGETHEPISAESSPRRSKRKLFGFLKRQKSKERQYSSQGSLQAKAAKGKAQPVVPRQNLTVPAGQPRSASTGDIGIYGEFELRRPSVDDTESNVSGSSSRADRQQPMSTV
ncbi:phospholipid transfer protein C2CD2L isoform X4 [Strongylocentrotus purpuratus]|uniref:C2 domain-containing protein n=1 Tax=Strongylocentrotus purpuratus TaxID=7668 RepID=A0A7M7NC23_STRPU|nr:phospholipid transfer protein C2CD2L isoform X4 [Strongylocentrotus purpuratus]